MAGGRHGLPPSVRYDKDTGMAKPDADAERPFEVDIAVLVEVLEIVGAAEVGVFVTSIAAEMESLAGHLEACSGTGSPGALGREAHHLSGGCRALGLSGIGSVCARIEADAREGLTDRFSEYSVELAHQRHALSDWWSTASADPRLSAFWPLA
jgi:HPt (histidine-containing phosphotransfer) domain-containing protein